MHTERMKLETDHQGNLKDIPKLPPNKKLEAIFIIESDDQESTITTRRKPHPDIIGRTQISDDIIDSIPESD